MPDNRRHAHSIDFCQLVSEIDQLLWRNAPWADVLQHVCTELCRLFGCALVWVTTQSSDGAVEISARSGRATNTAAGLASACPCLSVPLLSQGEHLGVLTLHPDAGQTLSPAAVAQLRDFAGHLAASLLAARHRDQIRLQTAALDAAANGITITDRQGIIQYVNPAFAELTGYTAADIVGRTPNVLKSGRHPPAFYRRLWQTISAGKVWRGEMHNRRRDGSLYIDEQTITPVKGPDGAITHFISIRWDVSEQRRQEERIQHLATHDPLTNLPNRRVMLEHLQRIVARCKRGPCAVLLVLDIDNFQLLNDTAGHHAGDQVLVEVARLAAGMLRAGDLLTRMGSDEFAALLENRFAARGREDQRAAAPRCR